MVPKRLALHPGTANPLAAFGLIGGMVFPILMFPAAILYGLAELLIPELARCAASGSRRRIRYLTIQSLRVAILYGILFSGLEFLLAEPLCLRFYKNADAGFWLRLYALLIPMLYCDAITDAIIKGLGQQKACVRYNILTNSLDVILLFFLMPHYGLKGYYLSFLITHLINFLLSLRRLLRITGIHFHISVPLKLLTGFTLSLGMVSCFPQPSYRLIAYPPVLCAILTLLGVISRKDLGWIKGLVLHTRQPD